MFIVLFVCFVFLSIFMLDPHKRCKVFPPKHLKLVLATVHFQHRHSSYSIIVRTQRSEEALEQLRYESLESRRERHVLKFVKKCVHGRAPQFFNNYFNMFNRDLVPRKTRQSHHLRPPSVKLECSKKSFFTMVVLFLIVICNL